MKLVIGLGNPGKKYVNTRHNMGLLVAEALSAQILKSKHQIPNKSKIIILKSQNFMNESGSFVGKMLTDYRLQTSDLYIVHDDLDISLGSYKIQFGIGPKIHNGVNSIEQEIGTKDFWRVRIGVDNRKSDDRTLGEEYVLQDFTEEERVILDKTIKEVVQKLISSLQSPVSS
jgi:peptidyl-tRNA hydrolase, PTH1 family